MNIEYRKLTNNHWRFGYALLFVAFCLISLPAIALPEITVFEGRAEQRTRRVAEEITRVDQASSKNLPESGGLIAANSEARIDALSAVGVARVDVNLSRQMLSVIDGSGRVMKVLPISSGSGGWYVSEGERRRAVTPTGSFRVYRKIPGWRKSPLGLMYYPVYIVRGIAIHGSPYVPRRPASHGCIRIPMSAAVAFYNSMPLGTVVNVHY
ncbi:MAG TPA: L,D-transpeptidase [Blastocatellia bacterium]|nr:L,D-transpeptidase [Blastocatellia bacterium]